MSILFSMCNKAAIGMTLVLLWLAISPLQVSAQHPVVVELFTSEGCSSCPPADALLTELSHQRMAGNTELVLLGEHVEYWNSASWTDRFSSSVFTQRQKDYVQQLHLATAYTPQIVIDGHLQGVGNNVAAVRRMIAEASTSPKAATVSLRFLSAEELQIKVEDPSSGSQLVLLAITEDGLMTNVRGGENGGRVLKHSAVVRNLRSLGSTSGGKFETTVKLPAKSDWKKADLRAVVLVQNASSGLVLGAASIPCSPANPAPVGR